MEFRILGALEVVAEGRKLELGGTRQRAVLAYLILHAGEVVAADRVIEDVWSGNPPETAANTLQVYVSKLRKALHADNGTEILRTRRPGYVLEIEPEQIDAGRFERMVEHGRAQLAGGDPETAAETLREALLPWRGPALADLALEPFAKPYAARLEELRLVALEERVTADLQLGRHADVVPELERLVREHPLREGPRAHLMLALYRTGRQADALRVYQDARAMLVEELGLDPSPSLQQLEKAILTHDASVQAPPVRPRGTLAPRPPVAPREVRKTVTIVAAELSVMPTGSESLDPEALRAATDRCADAVAMVLERHGATVQRVSPEALRGVFGVPAVHEDDALRALRAAAELPSAVGDLSGELSVWLAAPSLRGGVATGEVVVAEPLVPGAEPVGEPIDLARRLQNAAGAGEILVADVTRRLAGDAIRAKEAEPVALPGRKEPAPAWHVVEILPGVEQIGRHREAPLIGRRLELAQLRQAFDRAVHERRCSLFTVLGPAGIGKSRLADELQAEVGDAARVVTGRCLSYGEGITFWPIAEIVKQAVGEDVRAGLEAVLGADGEARLIVERVAGAIGAGEAGGGGEETFWAVRKLLEALSRVQPLIVVLDDVHWAEPTLLDLVDHVADWSRDAPILLVCLSRPDLLDLRPTWAGGKVNATSIFLEPLTEGECDLLIENLIGGSGLPEEARTRIGAAAEGNPLFVEQTLSMLIHDGILRRVKGQWVADEVPDAVVPPTIHALLAARLDRLDLADRRMVEHAAVVGKVFWPSAVAALAASATETAATVAPRLQRLVTRELFTPDPSMLAGEEGYRFRHLLIREAAYHAIPKRERAVLHERAGGWLERVSDERVREYEELIGYHLEQAHRYLGELGPLDERGRELAVQAGEHLAAAGARALKRGDVPAAVSLLARAAALLPLEHRHRTAVLLRLAEALRERGDFHWADSVLDELLEVAAETGSQGLEAHARVVRLRIELVRDPTLSPERLVSEAESVAEAFGDLGDDEGLAKAWFVLAWIPWVRGQAGATEAALERAIEHGRKARDERAYWQALHLSVGAALFGPDPVPDAVRRCEELVAAGESRRVESSAIRALAVLRAMQGDAAEARRLVSRDRELLQDLGLRFLAAAAAEAYGMVELLLGDPEAAAVRLREGYDALGAMAAQTALSTIAAVFAQAEYACGRLDEAVRLSEVSERATSEEDLSTQVQWRGPRAKVLAERGEAEEAERLAREAVALAERTDFLSMHADAQVDLAEVLRLLGRSDEAGPALRVAEKLYKRKGNTSATKKVAALVKSLPVPR